MKKEDPEIISPSVEDERSETEPVETETEPEEEVIEDDDQVSSLRYAMSARQFLDELRAAISVKKDRMDCCNRYWLIDYDPDASMAICADTEDHFLMYGIPYTVNGDVIAVNFEGAHRVKIVYTEL